jgi:predicted RNA polymerase sigma factor
VEAVAAYDSAIDLTHDTAERQYLQHRRDRANCCSQRR